MNMIHDAELARIAAKAVGAPVFRNALGMICVDALLGYTNDMRNRVGVVEDAWPDGKHVVARIRFDDGDTTTGRII